MLKRKQNGRMVNGAARKYLGQDVLVDVDELENASPAVVATAVCGSTTVEVTHSFGPNDGGFGPMPDDHVQKSIDALMDRATRAAAHGENVRVQLAKYKPSA